MKRYYVRAGVYEFTEPVHLSGVRLRGEPSQRWKRWWYRFLLLVRFYHPWPGP